MVNFSSITSLSFSNPAAAYSATGAIEEGGGRPPTNIAPGVSLPTPFFIIRVPFYLKTLTLPFVAAPGYVVEFVVSSPPPQTAAAVVVVVDARATAVPTA